jgi:hypothetical protein
MRLTIVAVYFAALMSSGYAQSLVSQTPTKKQSIGKICSARLDAYGLRDSVRRKYWWYCWRRGGK